MAMARPDPITSFKQSLKSDAFYADELINIYFLRPIAAAIVWVVYPTRVTPNHLTLIALLLGLAAAYAYVLDTAAAVAVGGLLMTAKDVFDDADGQLARAKEIYSRRGRFLDSISDFVVNLAVFAAITSVVYQSTRELSTIVLGIASFWGITLRVSYHVFYQVSYLHREDRYKLNRITEEITEEDRRGDRLALRLQQLFLVIYGWQDRAMYRLDRWCRAGQSDDRFMGRWYCDKVGMRLSGLMGFGTELMLLAICSVLYELHLYLMLNVVLMNTILLTSVFYRRVVLRRRFTPFDRVYQT